MSDVRDLKRAMRERAEAERAEVVVSNPAAAEALCRNFIEGITLAPSAIVAGYKAFGSEVDVLPVLRELRVRGHQLALPVIVAPQKPLLFRSYVPGDELAAGVIRHIWEPLPMQPQIQPTVLLVPLLAFDSRGYRLGYGGGYYDRTINSLRQKGSILAVGLALACQQKNDVPIGAHDAKMDCVVTEKGIIRF